MRKPRSDSKLATLPPEQKVVVDAWLLEENLGYEIVCERVKQHFGISVSPTAVRQYYYTLFVRSALRLPAFSAPLKYSISNGKVHLPEASSLSIPDLARLITEINLHGS